MSEKWIHYNSQERLLGHRSGLNFYLKLDYQIWWPHFQQMAHQKLVGASERHYLEQHLKGTKKNESDRGETVMKTKVWTPCLG